jgi:hypothetical protein
MLFVMVAKLIKGILTSVQTNVKCGNVALITTIAPVLNARLSRVMS